MAGKFVTVDPAVVKPEDRWVVVTCYLDGANASWIEAVYRVGDPAIVALFGTTRSRSTWWSPCPCRH